MQRLPACSEEGSASELECGCGLRGNAGQLWPGSSGHCCLLKISHKRPESRLYCASRLYQVMQVVERSLQADLPAAQGRLEGSGTESRQCSDWRR